MPRGSIQKRLTKSGEARFRVRFDAPDELGGRYQYSQTFATEDEAEAYLAQALTKIHAGTFVAASSLTLSDYLDQWIENRETMGRISPATAYSYANKLARLPTGLLATRLDKLTPLVFQRLYADQRKTQAATTVAALHRTLHAALAQAVAWRLLERSPLDGVQSPRNEPPPLNLWSAEQLGTFLAKTRDDPFAVAWWLMIDTGLRRGEIIGLQWGDLDLSAGTLAVHRRVTRDREGRELVQVGAKSRAGLRALILSPSVVTALKAHRARQNERRLASGAQWSAGDWVLDDGSGSRCPGWRLWGAFKRACDHAGVPPLRPHDLRHLNATLLMAGNVHPRIVQARLGHSQSQLTLNRYSHPELAHQAMAAELLDALFRALVPTDVPTGDEETAV